MAAHHINVFISHSWSYSGHYDTLSNWIFNEKWEIGQDSLIFHDYSVPKTDPIHNAPNTTLLRDAIYRKIFNSHVIVIPMGMYVNHGKWILEEINGAKKYYKPILAVNPWGQMRSSSIVQQHAKKHVGWQKRSVVSGIWELY